MSILFAALFLGTLSNFLSIFQGFYGGAMGYYVYEKRRTGKSEYGWAFRYSAIVALANIAVLFLACVIMMIGMYSFTRDVGVPFHYSSSLMLLFLSPISIFVLILYGIRQLLGFKELSSRREP